MHTHRSELKTVFIFNYFSEYCVDLCYEKKFSEGGGYGD